MYRAIAAVVGLTVVVGTGRALAQKPSINLGAGVTFPVGEYGDYAKTGWLASAGVTVPVGKEGVFAGGEVIYGSNKHSDVEGDKTNLPGILGLLGYRFGDRAKVGPYVYGSAGTINHNYKPASSSVDGESEWGFAWGAGAGVDLPVGKSAIWVEARYLSRSGTNFVPVMVGVSIPVGK